MLATFCNLCNLLFFSSTFFAAPLISSLFSLSKCRDSPVCSDRESVFAFVDLFPFFFSSHFPPSLFFFFSSTAVARTHLLLSRGASVHPRRSPVFLRTTHTLTKSRSPMYTVARTYDETFISEHFHIFLLSLTRKVKVPGEIKLGLFL
jgi:hypothetical protein